MLPSASVGSLTPQGTKHSRRRTQRVQPCSDTQLLIVGREFSKGRLALRIDLPFVSQRALEGNPAMCSNLVEFDLALIKQADQSWPRDIQQIGGLLGRQFRMDRDQLDCIAPAHLIQNLNE